MMPVGYYVHVNPAERGWHLYRWYLYREAGDARRFVDTGTTFTRPGGRRKAARVARAHLKLRASQ